MGLAEQSDPGSATCRGQLPLWASYAGLGTGIRYTPLWMGERRTSQYRRHVPAAWGKRLWSHWLWMAPLLAGRGVVLPSPPYFSPPWWLEMRHRHVSLRGPAVMLRSTIQRKMPETTCLSHLTTTSSEAQAPGGSCASPPTSHPHLP